MVEEAQEQVTSLQFAEWCAFQALEPQGYRQDSWYAAMIACSITNAIRQSQPRARGTPPLKILKIEDFLPRPAEAVALTEEQENFIRNKHGHRKSRRRQR